MRLFRGVLAVWHRLPLRAQGWVLNAIPFVAVLISAGFAFWGNRQRERTETAVTRHFAMVSTLSDLFASSLAAETGVRGFLLSQRTEFLAPFTAAQKRLPDDLEQLRALATSEPGEKPRIEKSARAARIGQLANEELHILTTLKSQAGQNPAQLYPTLARGKRIEDQLRLEVRAMRARENELLQERLGEIRAVRSRDYIAIYVTLFIGLVSRFVSVYLFNTGIGTRARKLTENVRQLGQGELPHQPTNKPDALGKLERELESVAQRLRGKNV